MLWLRIWVLGPFMGLSGPSVSFLVPRFPSKSGLIHKHIVKHIVKHTETSDLVSFLVPWYPSKSGPTHKHIVKHIENLARRTLWAIRTTQALGSHVESALFHTVPWTVTFTEKIPPAAAQNFEPRSLVLKQAGTVKKHWW